MRPTRCGLHYGIDQNVPIVDTQKQRSEKKDMIKTDGVPT
jgi:hypothetical protein